MLTVKPLPTTKVNNFAFSHSAWGKKNPILWLIPRTTVTSLSSPKDTRCKTHHICVNAGVPFWTRDKTHKLRARWKASLSGIRADVTVVRTRGETKYIDLGIVYCLSECENISNCIGKPTTILDRAYQMIYGASRTLYAWRQSRDLFWRCDETHPRDNKHLFLEYTQTSMASHDSHNVLRQRVVNFGNAL